MIIWEPSPSLFSPTPIPAAFITQILFLRPSQTPYGKILDLQPSEDMTEKGKELLALPKLETSFQLETLMRAGSCQFFPQVPAQDHAQKHLSEGGNGAEKW